MSTIEFSRDMFANVVTNIVRGSGSSSVTETNYGWTLMQTSSTMLGLMANNINTTEITSVTSANVTNTVCDWTTTEDEFITGDEPPYTIDNNTFEVRIATKYNSAIRAGTITWFWLVQGDSGTPSFDLNDRVWGQIVGSVGDIGSGADLEMSDRVISVNDPLKVYNLRLRFVRTPWTYT